MTTMLDMRWCCAGFEAFYGNAGEQGAGILVGRDSLGEPEFTLQYRAVDRETEMPVNSEKPVASIIDVGVQYCPWCGSKLEKWYGRKIDVLYRPELKIPGP